jgi:hypothetical protein
MRLFSREKLTELPRYDQVVDAKVLPIVSNRRATKGMVFGFAVVLIDEQRQQTPAYILGKRPETVAQAIDCVLGAYGPQKPGYKGPQRYEGSNASAILPECALLDELAQTPSITHQLEQPFRQSGQVRESETFTQINYQLTPPSYEPLGPYDVD